jgi:helicase MOV-10
MLCPNFKLQGTCDDEKCSHFHPNLICDLCGIVCRNQAYFNHHLQSKRHAEMKKAAGRTVENGPKKCTICNMSLGAPRDVLAHINGQRHQGRLLEFSQRGVRLDTNTIIVDDSENCFECLVCETLVWHQKKNVHERTLRHKRKERFLEIRASLDEAEMDKNGVSVSPSGKDAFDFGLVPSGRATRDFSLTLDDSQARIILRSATLTSASRQQQSPYVNIYLTYSY